MTPPELLRYQTAFLADPARFKIGLWARQTGKDFTCTCEAVLDCIRTKNTTWLIVAAGERQALESLEKAKEWADILKRPIHEFSGPSSTIRARANSAQIKWSNGSRIIALPANSNTIRGYSANLILTEFAFHEDPDAVWRAVYPSISNPLRGGLKKVRIISTPNGLSNKFARLWFSTETSSESSSQTLSNLAPDPNRNPNLTRNLATSLSPRGERARVRGARSHRAPRSSSESANSPVAPSLSSFPSVQVPSLYFRSRITIHDAIASGLPINAAELESGLNDPEAWAQEYLCEFSDNSTILLPYELIESAESELATETSTVQSLSASAFAGNPRAPHLYAGIDFARKNHLTVCWIVEALPVRTRSTASQILSPGSTPHAPDFLTRSVLTLHNLSTPEQLQILLPYLERCQRICVDYTGPGIGFGDYLQKELRCGPAMEHQFRNYTHNLWRNASAANRIELCQFTPAFKAELFPRLRSALENRELLIPGSRDIREDLHSIYRTVTNTGQITYRAHSTPDGHADRTTALALSLRAAQSSPQPTAVRSYASPPDDPPFVPPIRHRGPFG